MAVPAAMNEEDLVRWIEILMTLQELFRKTVGPLRDVFLIYNSQGHSKGMAIVAFQRKGDAAVARAKYHGKVVDGRTCTHSV